MNVHLNTRAKGNYIKGVRDSSIILICFEGHTPEIVPKVTKRPGVFRDRNHKINSVGLMCVVMCETSQILTGNIPAVTPNSVSMNPGFQQMYSKQPEYTGKCQSYKKKNTFPSNRDRRTTGESPSSSPSVSSLSSLEQPGSSFVLSILFKDLHLIRFHLLFTFF